jgi:hypothetical protein
MATLLEQKQKHCNEKKPLRVGFVSVSSDESKRLLDDICEGLDALGLTYSELKDEGSYSDVDLVVFVEDDALDLAKKNIAVPVAIKSDGCKDYNPLLEEGNGFYFASPTKWEIFAAIVKAKETYQFPYDWGNLLKSFTK